MLKQLDTYDWEEAFKYAEGSYVNSSGGIDGSPGGIDYSFTREDVTEIYGIIEGENDGDLWRIIWQT